MRLIPLIIFLALFIAHAPAQNPKVVKARALAEAGKSSKAYALLNKSFKKSGNIVFARELIRLYADDGNLKSAMDWSNKVALDNSTELEDAVLLTDLWIMQGDYQKALDKCINYALRFENAQPLYDRGYICENLIKAKNNSILYEVDQVPFNAFSDEISIAAYRRNYVLSSNRIGEMAEGSGSNAPFDLYLLQKDFDKWRHPSYLLKSRDKKYHRTTLSYTADGNYVYFTLSEYLSSKAKKKGGGPVIKFRIFRAISMGNEWVEIEELPFQADGFNYKDPAISPDGDVLVFASDQDGEGGLDLFYSTYNEGKWSNPVNLGSQVNTADDEHMPTFNRSGSLYFSSNNKFGFGGYDIYETSLDDGYWLRPSILPPPINSTSDDMSMIESEVAGNGFLASNRPGGNGGYDIYTYTGIDMKLGVTVLDASNGSTLDLAEVKLIRDGIIISHGLTNEKGIAEFRIGKNTNYEIEVSKDGFTTDRSELHSRMATEGRILYWNIKLKPEKKDEQAQAKMDYLEFTAEIVDRKGKPLAGLDVRLVNTTTQKMKIVTTDSQGYFSQDLKLGNEYEFIINHGNERFVGVFSTKDLNDTSPRSARYTIGAGN